MMSAESYDDAQWTLNCIVLLLLYHTHVARYFMRQYLSVLKNNNNNVNSTANKP